MKAEDNNKQKTNQLQTLWAYPSLTFLSCFGTPPETELKKEEERQSCTTSICHSDKSNTPQRSDTSCTGCPFEYIYAKNDDAWPGEMASLMEKMHMIQVTLMSSTYFPQMQMCLARLLTTVKILNCTRH